MRGPAHDGLEDVAIPIIIQRSSFVSTMIGSPGRPYYELNHYRQEIHHKMLSLFIKKIWYYYIICIIFVPSFAHEAPSFKKPVSNRFPILLCFQKMALVSCFLSRLPSLQKNKKMGKPHQFKPEKKIPRSLQWNFKIRNSCLSRCPPAGHFLKNNNYWLLQST